MQPHQYQGFVRPVLRVPRLAWSCPYTAARLGLSSRGTGRLSIHDGQSLDRMIHGPLVPGGGDIASVALSAHYLNWDV